MAALSFYKVTSLPQTLQPNSVYFVENGTYAETYVTNTAGVARGVGNSEMITGLTAAKSAIEVVADIAARDALVLTANTMVLVVNAIGDATVSAGAALYVYVKSTTSFTKVAEYESMDVTLQWANIQGKPASSVAAIDAAVAASHTHANQATLDLLSASGGSLLYNGNPIATQWTATDW